MLAPLPPCRRPDDIDARRVRNGGGQLVTWGAVTRVPLELYGRRVQLRPLGAGDFEAWREGRTRARDWVVEWEPQPLAGPAGAAQDRRVFAARCGARDRERQLGSGYGFGIFVDGRF